MVVLTVNVCWGCGEHEGLHQLCFQSLLWELHEVGWEIPQAADKLPVSSFPCTRKPLSSHCSPCATLPGGSTWYCCREQGKALLCCR